jgi:LuxR family transcriptional regulator
MAVALAAQLSSHTGLAVLDSILPTLRVLGPQGFILVSNMGLRGPEFFHSEYPKEWQREYEARNYTWGDPILIWSMMWTGDRRWSEIRSPDPRGVMEAAKHFGITFGAIFSRGGVKKTVLSLARADREFTNEEMTLISGLMDRLVAEAALDRSLTIQELDTLRHLRDGLSHKEIAVALGIGHSTVKLRLSNARAKLGAVSNVHALAVALQRNLL